MAVFIAILLNVGLVGTPVSALADGIQMLPPVGETTNTVCPSGSSRILTWDGQTAIACAKGITASNGNLTTSGTISVGTTNAVCDSTQAGALRFNTTTMVFEGCNGTVWASLSTPVCTTRYAGSSMKGDCGFTSTVYCQAGERATSGGMNGGGNDALQNSEPVTDSATGLSGWSISVLDTVGGGTCTGNALTSDGTVYSGNPPQFPIAGGSSYMSGRAVAVCCH